MGFRQTGPSFITFYSRPQKEDEQVEKTTVILRRFNNAIEENQLIVTVGMSMGGCAISIPFDVAISQKKLVITKALKKI